MEEEKIETLSEVADMDNKDTDTVETSEDSQVEDSALVKLAKQYTGESVTSEEEALDVIEETLEELSAYQREERAMNRKLMDALNSEPDFRELIGHILRGATLEEAVVQTLDVDNLQRMEGEPDYDAWSKAKESRLERLKAMEEEDRANAERIVRIEQNRDGTKAMIDKFASAHKMSPEETKELIGKLGVFASDIMELKVSEEVLDMIFKSMRMEEIIEDAKAEGALDERNKKIETIRMKKGDTDGLPAIEAGMGEMKEKTGTDSIGQFFDDVFSRRIRKD